MAEKGAAHQIQVALAQQSWASWVAAGKGPQTAAAPMAAAWPEARSAAARRAAQSRARRAPGLLAWACSGVGLLQTGSTAHSGICQSAQILTYALSMHSGMGMHTSECAQFEGA